MAIDLPLKPPEGPDDSDADALFEEAREIERARRRRKLAGASVVAGIALALGIGFGVGGGGGGGGGGASLARHASGGAGAVVNKPEQAQTFTSEIVQGSGSVCSSASQPATPGDPPPGQCVTELPNGQRYQCPSGLVQRLSASAIGDVATDSACHRVLPPTIPVSWRPSIRQMHAVTACLQHAGLSAGGGTTPPAALRAYPDTPIASVLIAGAAISPTRATLTAKPTSSRPTIVSFYRTTAQARQAYNRFLPTTTKQGQGVAVRGRVLYTWNSQPAGEAGTERSCLTAA